MFHSQCINWIHKIYRLSNALYLCTVYSSYLTENIVRLHFTEQIFITVRVYSLTSQLRGHFSVPDQSMLDLWWTKWHWNRFFLLALCFSPVNIIPPMLHVRLYVSLTRRTQGQSLGTVQNVILPGIQESYNRLSESRKHFIRKRFPSYCYMHHFQSSPFKLIKINPPLL
jgi:hypothetical protein